jgi:ATP-dependent protease Clp ATPase subunit
MRSKHYEQLSRIFSIFSASQGTIRPHFILTGPSGSGKTYTVSKLVEENNLHLVEINAAQITKEGMSGASLSKVLSPLANSGGKPTVVFVDEFDKLFISGNNNSDAAHEVTTVVQNEFLKILESDTTSVFGDYGKYINIPCDKTLFIFAGAFNGEEDIDLDRLREIGVKTEFLGRVGLVYSTKPVTLEELLKTMKECNLLKEYLELFENVKRVDVEKTLEEQITDAYEMNTLGFRMVTSLIHSYFIDGPQKKNDKTKAVFTRKLTLEGSN